MPLSEKEAVVIILRAWFSYLYETNGSRPVLPYFCDYCDTTGQFKWGVCCGKRIDNDDYDEYESTTRCLAHMCPCYTIGLDHKYKECCEECNKMCCSSKYHDQSTEYYSCTCSSN